ncbi:MBOAT-domain-containing protein [Violaceomyces palustris]|uniref:MBOAT-domain-containing protein n=1 Tax=Violaceomyces palustris TaxID=1673888 RepID=A0ACD0NWE1_9BASI|nr:MBOAT-domain-containing protein [Violaceomyces palustris]
MLASLPSSFLSTRKAPTSGEDTNNVSSGLDTPDSESDQIITTSTVTTTTRSKLGGQSLQAGSSGGGSSTTTVTHHGAKGLTHSVGHDGAVHLHPLPASSSRGRSRKVRAVVTFVPRQSHFDRFNQSSSGDPFRGFYTLFWISLTLFVLNTSYTSFSDTGSLLSLSFATLFSKDAGILALSDAVLIASTFICVPFAKVCQKGWVRYWPTAVAFQHLWQATLLGVVIKWARYRQWPWVQSGFFVLHTLSMMMKIHSYMAVNGSMADLYHRMRRVEGMLEERVAEVSKVPPNKGTEAFRDAWAKALEEAGQLVAQPEDKEAGRSEAPTADTTWPSPESQRGTSSLRLRKNATPLDSANGATEEREKSPSLKQAGEDSLDARVVPEAEGRRRKRLARKVSVSRGTIRDPHPLANHPDKLISELARDIENMREDLLSSPEATTSGLMADEHIVKQDPVMWPENVTYANFWDYLLVPTLVYELQYPRTTTVRPFYLLEKVLATFGTFFVIYVITEHWIMPNSPNPETPFLRSFLTLAVPMMTNYLLIFYLIFEGVCNGFAEITRFADREFYQDWWNATSMDVFSRKWNKPVHSFLLKHVYASTIAAWGLSRNMAMFLTFLLSSLVHELVMAIVSGKIRGYLFAAQMIQLPLIFLSQIPFVKRNETLGNMIFWVGLMAGFPLLNIGYLVY